jgi:hypothetical protein
MYRTVLLCVALVLFSTTAFAKSLPTAKPERLGFSSERLDRIKQMTQQYVDEGKLAGVITMVAKKGKIVHFEVVGNRGAGDATQ